MVRFGEKVMLPFHTRIILSTHKYAERDVVRQTLGAIQTLVPI